MNTAVHISKLYLEIILLILLLHGHKLCLQAGSEVVYSFFVMAIVLHWITSLSSKRTLYGLNSKHCSADQLDKGVFIYNMQQRLVPT